jgi:thioester reductase-like protein/acyl-CoA synthetase (AMP-forming)/AMP-acid ligase II/aryl carrier-like protein
MPLLSSVPEQKRPVNGFPKANKYHKVIAHAIDELAQFTPDAVFAATPRTSDPVDGFRDVTYRQLADTIDRAALVLEKSIDGNNDGGAIGYIGPSDLRYAILAIAAVKINMKVGCMDVSKILILTASQMLYLSPRNSLEGQLHILEHAKCKVFSSPSRLLAGVGAILAARQMQFVVIPELDDLLDGPTVPARQFNKTFEELRNEPLVILHSSGSTSLPKPVGYSHGAIAAQCSEYGYEAQGGLRTVQQCTTDAQRLLIGFPMFHAGGLFFPLGLAIFGHVALVMPPCGQPLNADLVNKINRVADVRGAVLPPAILEDLAANPVYLEGMQNLKCIITGGAPLPRVVGEAIQSAGPRIYNILASTETGCIPAWQTDKEDWQYMRFRQDLGIELRPHSEDTYELHVVRANVPGGLQAVFENYPHLQDYTTHDLFRQHPDPEKSDLWLSAGRFDDVIVLLNGEKFNPIEIEHEIQKHPAIHTAIIAGRDRTQAAILIEPVENSHDADRRAKLLDDIWPTIEQANTKLPAHGRLYKNMVLLTKVDKPMRRTPKGSVMRFAVYDDYAKEIDLLYTQQQPQPATNGKKNSLNDSLDTTSLRQQLEMAAFPVTSTLEDNSNLFEAGMDSLHVLRLVHHINVLKGSHYIEPATVYMNPTLSKLANALKTDSSNPKLPQDRRTRISEMLSRVSLNLPKPPPPRKVAILTGSSGSLGSYLLKVLEHRQPDFSHIHCLVRTIPETHAFLSTKVTFHLCNFSDPLLGLSYETYTTIVESTTHILHNAWTVDFNLSLDSFTPNLLGTRHLIDLAIRARHRPRLFFISSVATVFGASSPVSEVIYSDADSAQAMGYAESKHIAELLLQSAAKTSNLQATVCRVGQIAGPVVEKGVWNRREWVPSIITTSKALKCLPRSLGPLGKVEWIPVDILAQIIYELLIAPDSPSQQDLEVFHVINPSATDWTTLLPTVQTYLGKEVELVSLAEWMSRLRACTDTVEVEKYPALKLLGFFEGVVAGEKAGKKFPELETERARAKSRTLSELERVSEEWMGIWMRQWGYGKEGQNGVKG